MIVGAGTVIGAGTLVAKSIPDNVLYTNKESTIFAQLVRPEIFDYISFK